MSMQHLKKEAQKEKECVNPPDSSKTPNSNPDSYRDQTP